MTQTSPSPRDDVARQKRQLRAAARARRRERSVGDQERLAQRLVEAAGAAPLAGARRVALYVGVDSEPRTLPLVQVLADRGTEVLLPVVLPDLDLEWGRFVTAAQLQRSRHGLLEPSGDLLGRDAVATADVVVVPAFAVDADGRRLGQGGGCYDRALRRVAAGTPVMAVVFDDEVLTSALPEEPHDRRVTGRLPSTR